MNSITLPAERRAVARARAFVRRAVTGVLDTPEDAVLLTSELVSNVVEHAGTEVTVRVLVGPPVRIEICDGVAATEAFHDLIASGSRPVPQSATRGRGLSLVHRLASRVGLTDNPDGGKVVWFEL